MYATQYKSLSFLRWTFGRISKKIYDNPKRGAEGLGKKK
jgi:hypothetical protein